MFTSLLFKGGAILLLVTACLFFAWRIVRILNPKPPRPPKYTEYFVVEVRNGATIIVSKKEGGGRKGKRTKSLNLEGIASPAEGEDWFAESRDNLALFAGAKVRVQVRGFLRAVKTEDKWREEHLENCPSCRGEGTGDGEPRICAEYWERLCDEVEVALSHPWYARYNEWWLEHAESCGQCGRVVKYGGGARCPAAYNKMDEILEKYKDGTYFVVCLDCGNREATPVKEKCPVCGGVGVRPAARDVIVGTVWGESGACLNLEQLKSGWAKSVGEVSEEWAEAEKEAKGKSVGIWGNLVKGKIVGKESLEARVFALELSVELAIRALENGQKRACLKLLRDVLDED